MSQNYKIAEKESLKSATRGRSAFIDQIGLEIGPQELSDIKDAAHKLYLSWGDANVQRAYVQATLDYLFRKGALK